MIRLYQSQHEVIIELIKHSSDLGERLRSLERQKNKNSSNSSKPPSTDQVKIKKRSRSLREKSDRPVGGQIGHEGHTLERVSNPDHTELHQVHECSLCGKSLDEVQPIDLERRQVFDLPPMKIEVTEHQSEKKICPRCGCLNQASFPDGVDQAAQYGNRLKATAVYLNLYQFIPYDRLSGLFEDLFEHKPSQATLIEANRLCYEMVEPAEKAIKAELIKSKVVNFDESGMRIEGLRQWIHVACTSSLTYYAAHPSRGSEANVAMGILPEFKGIAVHDKWKSYYRFDCQHALCNGHHLRDLKAITELDGQVWPNDMKQLLLEIKKIADERRPTEFWFDHDEIERFEKRYDQMIQKGMLENPPPDPILNPDPPKKRGRKKQTQAKNLLDGLTECKSQVLAFMYNPLVPFDNNQAERDIRMMKVQQKISGTFRSKAGADMFCRIRGYISTARKNGVSVIDAIIGAFEGRPFMPPSATL